MQKRSKPYRSGHYFPGCLSTHSRPTRVRLRYPDKTIWDSIKEFINNGIKINNTFSKNKIGKYIYITDYYDSSMMIYLRKLKKLGILEDSGRADVFIKRKNVPKSLTTTMLMELSNKSNWKSWFIDVDMLE